MYTTSGYLRPETKPGGEYKTASPGMPSEVGNVMRSADASASAASGALKFVSCLTLCSERSKSSGGCFGDDATKTSDSFNPIALARPEVKFKLPSSTRCASPPSGARKSAIAASSGTARNKLFESDDHAKSFTGRLPG